MGSCILKCLTKCNYKSNRIHCWLIILAGIMSFCFLSEPLMASTDYDAMIEAAKDYFETEQYSPSGYWSDQSRQIVDTIEVIKALSPHSSDPNILNSVNRALQFVVDTNETSVDVLARKYSVLVNSTYDSNAIKTSLLSAQNADGGWGLSDGKQSNILDTILVMGALLRDVDLTSTKLDTSPELKYALQYGRDFIVEDQGANGCWILAEEYGMPSDIARTAMAIIVLDDIRRVGLVSGPSSEAVSNAQGFLEDESDANGWFQTSADTALAYRALLRIKHPAELPDSLGLLSPKQIIDTNSAAYGSWDDDVFTTAIILQTLNVVSPPVPPAMADLSVDPIYISFDPESPEPANSVAITAWIDNIGTISAENFYVEFHDRTLDTLITDPCFIDELLPGESVRLDVNYVHDSNLFGPHIIDIWADPNGDIPDMNPEDDIGTKIVMFGGKADLTIEVDDINFYTIDGNELTPDPCACEPFVLVATVTNIGKGFTESFDVNIVDTTDSSIYGQYNVDGLQHGQKAKLSLFLSLQQEGTHNFLVTVDPNSPSEPNGSIHEISENNNDANKSQAIGPYGGSGEESDIEITTSDISIPDTNVLPGDTITINATIRNTSDNDSNGFWVLITDGSPFAGGFLIDNSIYIDGIDAGDSVSISPVDYNVVYNPMGNEIFVLADSNSDISECVKINNLASKPLSLPNLPDLTSDERLIVISHNDVAVDPIIEVTATIRNIGAADANNVLVQFAIRDAVDPNLINVFWGNVIPSISANGGTKSTVGIWRPAWKPQQVVDYNLCVLIDNNYEVPESNEYNNFYEIQVSIENNTTAPTIRIEDDNNVETFSFGAYDTVVIEVNYPAFDPNFMSSYVWIEDPNGDFHWPYPDTESEQENVWNFKTRYLEPNDVGESYEVGVIIYSLWYPYDILEETSASFGIHPEIVIGTPVLIMEERFLRLSSGDSLSFAPSVEIFSRSNEQCDANMLVELYEPNDPCDSNAPKFIHDWYEEFSLEPGVTTSIPLASYDCCGITLEGDHELFITIQNMDGPEANDANYLIPVIPATGLNISKALDPEYSDPTEYLKADVSIVLESSGMLMESQALDVVLVIDGSSSMNYTEPGLSKSRLGYAQVAARGFAEQLLGSGEGHKIGVVRFDCEADEIEPLNDIFEDVNLAISGLEAYGHTSITDGLNLATSILSGSEQNRKRVEILLTDGKHECRGHPDPIADGNVIPNAIRDNITIVTIGLGYGADGGLLDQLALDTGGIYRFSPSSEDLEDIYDSIYKEITTTGIKDVEIVDTVAYDPNKTLLDFSSITPTPDDYEQDANSYTLIWLLPSMEPGEQYSLEYEIELFDLEAGEERVVNEELVVTAYNSQSQALTTLKIGPQSVQVYDNTTLTIVADKEEYELDDSGTLTVTFTAPDAMAHDLFATQEDFQNYSYANGVDVNSHPGSVVLWKNTATQKYNTSGTLNLIADAGSGSYWGKLDFSGWYPGQYDIYDRINNYMLSNIVSDLFIYDRETADDAWWQDNSNSWHGEASDMMVGNFLTTEEGWIVSVPITGLLDPELDSNDFTIEGWLSTDDDAILFYRGDGDSNYLSIYTDDTGGIERLVVECNLPGWSDPNVQDVNLAVDGNDWHYVCLTVEDRVAKLYIDGNEPNLQWTYDADVMNDLNDMPILIGGQYYPTMSSDYFTYKARIDEVSIYDRALEPNEIESNYQKNLDYKPSENTEGQIGYWNFDPSAQDQSRLQLGGKYVEAYFEGGSSNGLWRISGRNSEPNFPERSYIIAGTKSIDIIDANDSSLWMRFPTDRSFLWYDPNVRPSCIYAEDGRIYVGQDSHNGGLSIIDFRNDQIRLIGTDLAEDPIAHWRLDEDSGTIAYDSSGNDYNGVLLGDLSFTNDSNTGIIDGSLDFDGSDDYVNYPDISFDANGSYTFSTWFKANDHDYSGVIGDHNDCREDGWVLYYDLSSINLYSGAEGGSIASAGSISDDGETWYHIALTYDGNGVTGSGSLYLDGDSKGTYSEKQFTDSNSNFSIGVVRDQYWEGEFYFNGSIDDVRIYDSVLSDMDVKKLYALGHKTNSLGTIEDRFGVGETGFDIEVATPLLPSGYVHAVVAAKVEDVNYIVVGTDEGLSLIRDESNANYCTSSDKVTKVFLTDTNDLYFVNSEPGGDSVYAVYDIDGIIADFGPDDIYGYQDQNSPALLDNTIQDLYVVDGNETDSNNILYIATPRGLVRIEEDQGARAQSVRTVYLSAKSNEPDSNDYVKVLSGNSDNVVAVYADVNELWVVTGEDSLSVLSIIDLSNNKLKDRFTTSTNPELPAATVTSLDYGLVGTKLGAIAFDPGFVRPISFRARSIYSNIYPQGDYAASDWTDPITVPGTWITDPSIIDPNSTSKPGPSRYLELEATLTTTDQRITPILESISVGYTPMEVALGIQVNTASGQKVPSINIDPIAITSEHMGGETPFYRTFNIDPPGPGPYTGKATLYDTSSGAELLTASDSFIIQDPNPGTAISCNVEINRTSAEYYGDESVQITSTVFRNDNFTLHDLDAYVTILNPAKLVVGYHEYTIGSLQHEDWIEDTIFWVDPQLTPEPNYIVELMVRWEGQDQFALPCSTTFDIVSNCETLKVIDGQIRVNPETIQGGQDVVDISITAENISNLDLYDVNLTVEIQDINNPDDPNTIDTINLRIPSISIGSSVSISFEYSLVGFEPNEYGAFLSASFEETCSEINELVPLDWAWFEVVNVPQSSAPEYAIIDLGTLDGNSYAHALNRYGNVTGYIDSDSNSHGFCWRCGEMFDLDLLTTDHNSVGWGIDDFEQIVGSYYAPSADANSFIWRWESQDFNDLETPDSYPIEAYGINLKGQVTGYYTTSAGETRPFIWHKRGDTVYWDDLGDSGLFDANSIVYGISDIGGLAGYWENAQGKRGLIRHNGVIIDAGQFKGTDTYFQAINENGEVVGYSDDVNDTAILSGDGIILAIQAANSVESRAYGINADGKIVGTYREGSDWKAFVWSEGAAHELVEQIAFYENDPDRWELAEARAINQDGQIVGYGVIDGNTHAFRMDPLPFAVRDPNLVLWLRADTGVVKDVNNMVSKWIDQSFNDNDLTAPGDSGDSNRPEWISSLSCCDPVVRFDGNDLLSKQLAATYDGNSTIFMVVSTSSVETGTLFASENNNNEANAFEIELSDPNLQLSAGTPTYNKYGISDKATESVILEIVIDEPNVSFYKNGLLVNTATMSANKATRYTDYVLGRSRDGTLMKYDVAEVLIFEGALTDDHRQDVEDYLIAIHRLYGPADIEDPELWYKADAEVTMDSNDKVSIWADQSGRVDQSGNKNPATQDNPNNRPTWVDSVFECEPAIRFDGSSMESIYVIDKIDSFLIIDRSGSMAMDYWEDGIAYIDLAKDAAIEYARAKLEDSDIGHRVGLITFSSGNNLRHELDPNLAAVTQAIDTIPTPSGYTHYKQAIEATIDAFNADPSGSIDGQIRHAIFLSDGADTSTDDLYNRSINKPYQPYPQEFVTEILGVIEDADQNGITFHTVALGGRIADPCDPDYDPYAMQLLQDMADAGNGTFSTCVDINDSNTLITVFHNIYLEVIPEFWQQTLFFVLKTEEDVSTRQVLWAVGDPNRGLNLYIDANELYFNVWNKMEEGAEPAWGPKYVSTPIEPNTAYLVDFVYDNNGTATIKGYLNGSDEPFDQANDVGKLVLHKKHVGIGGNFNKPILFHDDTNDVNNFYVGYIAEVLYDDTALSDEKRKEIELYLAEKYGFEIEQYRAPVADANEDFTVVDLDWDYSAQITLEGSVYSESNDPNLSYQWYDDKGVLIGEGNSVTIDRDIGTYSIELHVTDEHGNISIDTIEVEVLPRASDLIAHWKFDEDANAIAFDSAAKYGSDSNGIHAEVNSPDANGCWSSGRIDSAIRLISDSNEYIDLDPNGDNVKYMPGRDQDRTIMGWFEAGDNEDPTFFSYGTTDSNITGGQFAITASSNRLAVTDGNNTIGIENFCTLIGWHHIAVVLREDVIRIYLDGIKQEPLYLIEGTSDTLTLNTVTWSDDSYAYIGRDLEGNYFDGRIDDVRVYARGLRDSEIPVIQASVTRYRVVDPGLLAPVDNPQSSEVSAINDEGQIVGDTDLFLDPNATYYWRIDEVGEYGTTKGDTWNFTTESE